MIVPGKYPASYLNRPVTAGNLDNTVKYANANKALMPWSVELYKPPQKEAPSTRPPTWAVEMESDPARILMEGPASIISHKTLRTSWEATSKSLSATNYCRAANEGKKESQVP